MLEMWRAVIGERDDSSTMKQWSTDFQNRLCSCIFSQPLASSSRQPRLFPTTSGVLLCSNDIRCPHVFRSIRSLLQLPFSSGVRTSTRTAVLRDTLQSPNETRTQRSHPWLGRGRGWFGQSCESHAVGDILVRCLSLFELKNAEEMPTELRIDFGNFRRSSHLLSD